MMSGGLEASEDEPGSQGYGLHLKRGGDPKDPSSDWPPHKLVMLPVVNSLYRTHTSII